MRFGSDHKVIVSTLTKQEAKYFIEFLEEENARHKKEIIHLEGYLSMLTLHPKQYFYESAILRHKEDIKETNETIEKVKGVYKL